VRLNKNEEGGAGAEKLNEWVKFKDKWEKYQD
jgi:hypothetical protein